MVRLIWRGYHLSSANCWLVCVCVAAKVLTWHRLTSPTGLSYDTAFSGVVLRGTDFERRAIIVAIHSHPYHSPAPSTTAQLRWRPRALTGQRNSYELTSYRVLLVCYNQLISRLAHDAINVQVPLLGVETSEPLPLEKLMQHVEILYYDRVILFEGTSLQITAIPTCLCVTQRTES